MTEDDIEIMFKMKKCIEENIKERVKRQTGIRMGQAHRLSRGEDVIDYDFESEVELDGKERRFMESFDLLRKLKLYWISNGFIRKIKDPVLLEEALKIYMEIYERTFDVLVEVGEVGYINRQR